MKLSFFKFILNSKFPLKTSHGVFKNKITYFLKWEFEGKKFLAECPYFYGLSLESENQVVEKLKWICNNFSLNKKEIFNELKFFPSVLFAYEQILQLFITKKSHIYFPSNFTSKKKGININGLIWIGTIEFMKKQIQEKINQGFRCLKLKIGISWEKELKLLQFLRKEYSAKELEIRVDANGAFEFEQAKKVLEELFFLEIHSIEQPIKKNWKKMAKLCSISPIPIALDEDLIGINEYSVKKDLLESVVPHYLIFKPSLIGGIYKTLEWIKLCKKYNISWWITSALESNIGLNFIAQWTFTLNSSLIQGLGTGDLFINNIKTPLFIKGYKLFFSLDDIVNH